MMTDDLSRMRATVIGAGLAGSEAAWQLAEAGIDVALVDMKPLARTPAHTSDACAELLCSNSLRSAHLLNAVGLLKEELRRLGSLVMHAAEETRVPAGDALAVDRERFSACVTAALTAHPRIVRRAEIVRALPGPEQGPVVIATGPLTAGELAADIARAAGGERLYFYDAIAPIVSADSLDRDVIFAASRYGKGGGTDYLNCPLDRARYDAFVEALLAAESVPPHDFEEPRFFQGCLPVEVVASGGREALRFGCMKPVGLDDPRTGRWPYAVVQLRKEDRDGQAYNLVGFQTKLKHAEQQRVFRMIPGMERAAFLRLGAMHRNTYLDSPRLLDAQMRLALLPHLRFAGQMTGVEGYVESAAHGLLVGLLLARELGGAPIPPPPPESALGALHAHVLGSNRLPGRPHEPQNINWSMFPPTSAGSRQSDGKRARSLRAIDALDRWAAACGVRLAEARPVPETKVVTPRRRRR